jgi:hypothetical protein
VLEIIVFTEDLVKSTYGITLEEFELKSKEQNDVCKICKGKNRSSSTDRLVVDHCHKTGKIRGLLCHHCNVMLANAGKNGDTVSVLEDGIRYLSEYF